MSGRMRIWRGTGGEGNGVPQAKLWRVELTQTEHFALRPSEPDSEIGDE
jgi:hypothetical protein